VAQVERTTLEETIEAPAQSDALAKVKLTAPFAGTLTGLVVAEGDRVIAGATIGHLIARESEAALNGALEMQRSAKTDAARADAERAIEIVKQSRIESALVAPATGIVVSRAAATGDRVAEGQELITVASEG